MKLSNKAPNNDYFLKATLAALAQQQHQQDADKDDQTPPMSPLRSPQLSSSSSSIASWSSSHGSQQMLADEGDNSNGSLGGNGQCNSKEDRATYNTRFARHHLETYRQNDRVRWNFDFDHNRPLDGSHHQHHHTVPRYQWEPAI